MQVARKFINSYLQNIKSKTNFLLYYILLLRKSLVCFSFICTFIHRIGFKLNKYGVWNGVFKL